MKGVKLKPAQYKELQGLTLQQRLEQLNMWHKAGEVTEEQLRYFSDRMIRKEHRRSSPSNEGPRRYRTVLEGEIHRLCDKLQHNIKDHIAWCNKKRVMLKDEELERIQWILGEYRPLPVLDEFLIIAMRYPYKKLNEMAVEYVSKYRIDSLPFWARLWENENFVPMDAVRLMIEDGKVKKCFTKEMLSYLLPLIEAQRDKEIQRLEWAIAVGFEDDTTAHRNSRLEAFNRLITAIKKV